jgi:thioredoxin 1
MMSMADMIKTEREFREIIGSGETVTVKFFAGWCPDCKRMDAFMPSVLEEFQQFPLYELNKDELPDLAAEYNVMGIPSLLVFKNGEKLGHLHSANAKTPEQVSEYLSEYYSK